MYANYLAGGELRLGYLTEGRLLRLDGPRTDRLVREGFPLVPKNAPVEDREVRFLPALLRPRKILCLLRSYRAHAEELGNAPPPAPIFFAKLENALTGHGEPIVLPADIEGEVHHEGELALVVGRGGTRIPAERAGDHVAAYTVANDVTARGLQAEDKERGRPWLRSKSRDTFLPLGPGLVPADRVADPNALPIRVAVNGGTRQESDTSRLLWPIEEIVAHASRWFTLAPGDLILTGTPEGVGPLAADDTVEVEVGGVGLLSNPVRAEEG